MVIRAERTLEERFSATGSRVTVNRNDIEQMGADTVADVLRQLPGVQTSGGASGNLEIRMRGMDRNATQILVMDRGVIIERGTHHELLALGGRYRDLYDRQFQLEQDQFINPGEEIAATG